LHDIVAQHGVAGQKARQIIGAVQVREESRPKQFIVAATMARLDRRRASAGLDTWFEEVLGNPLHRCGGSSLAIMPRQ
jgi:hypothetical protein